MSLIVHIHNDIADALRVGEEFGPLMLESTLESGETVVVAQGWCWGFMEGMRSQFDAWEPHLDMIDELVVPIAVLARLGDEDPELHELLDDQKKIAQLTGAIAESAAAIYEYSRSIGHGPPEPCRRQTAKGGAERFLSLRQREEVQEVLRGRREFPLSPGQSFCPSAGI